MTSHLLALSIDAFDPEALARFWGGVLGRDVGADSTGAPALIPAADGEFPIRFLPTTEPKVRPNQMHFDLTSATPEAQKQHVDTVLALGGRHLDIGQGPDVDHVVMADPEGNEFCVIPTGNNFLAGCGRIGALSSDGLQDVGYFWSEALGWPLVWDQDEETAIHGSPGGSKISWGGPPVNAKTGKNRWHLDLSPTAGDQESEVERLVSLGAAPVVERQCRPDWVALVDPGGNELCVAPHRAG